MAQSAACVLGASSSDGGFFANLFSTDFMPRAQCVGQRAEIIWLHVISDAAIALAYFSIPIALAYFVRRRRDVVFPWIFWLFAAFILACGTTHVFNIVAFWLPLYRLDGLVKAMTGGVSMVTAFFLWPLVPKALSLPSPSQLERLNTELNVEIAERRRAETRLEGIRDELEDRVRERTVELAEANESLAARIAEREAAEALLRESELLLQRKLAEIEVLYRTAPVGLCFLDGDLKIVRLNQAMADMAGVAAADAAGRLVAEGLPTLGRLIEGECRDVAASGRAITETSIRLNDGSDGPPRRWLASFSPVVSGEGPMLGVSGMVQDVTDRDAMEERLRQSQKTEAIGQLAAGIAHEINNWLTAIYGHLSMARARLPDVAAVADHLDQVLAAAEQAGHITKALLTFARNETVSRTAVELRTVVDDTMSLFAGLAPANIRVQTDTEEAEGLRITGDPNQIQQIVMNLAINARDAMGQGGLLEVKVAPLAELASGRPTHVRLTVADTGVGMSPEVQRRIFEPFFTTKPRGHGTGLGMSVVQGIARSHGAEVRVNSVPGRGTTFMIDFPIRTAEPGDADAGFRITPVEIAGGTVIIAEDNRMIRDLLGAGLRAAGFNVVEVKDGQELLDGLATLNGVGAEVSALVLDVDMPGKSGTECLRQLRRSGNATPVVLVSGGPIIESASEVNTYTLPKPFHIRELVATVSRAITECGPRSKARTQPVGPGAQAT